MPGPGSHFAVRKETRVYFPFILPSLRVVWRVEKSS